MIDPGEIHVWPLALDVPPQQARRLEQLISDEERRRAERFGLRRHRHRFVARRGLLRSILASYLQCSPRELRFVFGDQGKPALGGSAERTGIQFNLSHSADRALLAVARRRRVGIDIERVDPAVDVTGLIETCCTPSEIAEISRQPQRRRRELFLRAWTRKEAVAKACGRGLSLAPKEIEVSVAAAPPAKLLSIQGDRRAATRWLLYDLALDAEYAAAMAAEVPCCRIVTRNWPGFGVPEAA
ncbi:MAG: 4'-phosphopantetheinyl transferase superfamily protein [Planctomycetes bacterium]|nr:4'-phosphopantetheinyl transferase superfamily protein [Planctomycetota bacterium]